MNEFIANTTPALVPDIVAAPWDETQIRNLNARQQDPKRHPYTCGTKEKHVRGAGAAMVLHDDTLVATSDGWHCPGCDYVQNWAHRMDTQTSLQQMDAFIASNRIVLSDEQRESIDKLLD